MILGTVYRLQGAEFVSEFCRLLTDNKNLMDNQANPVVNRGKVLSYRVKIVDCKLLYIN